MAMKNDYTSALFDECSDMVWKVIYSNGICAEIFIKGLAWYLGVIG